MKAMPEDVQDTFGFALYLAQLGEKHPDAKPMKGFTGAGVLEIVEDYSSDTYRAVYTVRFADAVYVLHVFQKKSKHGIATPTEEIEKAPRERPTRLIDPAQRAPSALREVHR